MSLFTPKIQPPAQPPNTPTQADPSIIQAGQRGLSAYPSLISTSTSGLKRKANTKKTSLIGGE